MTRWGIASIVLGLLLLAGSAGAHSLFHGRMPERVPIHWRIDGQPDGWASKDQVFLIYYLLPTITLGLIVLGMFVLPWLSPRNFAVEGFRSTYDYMFFLIAALFAFMHGMFLASMIDGGGLSFRPFLAGLFGFFALIGNVLGKVKSNFWMGVRTPWTLADPLVWQRTHRMAAWSFTAVGAAGAIAALVGVSPVICFVGLMAAALWPVIYSLILYKRLERDGKLVSQQQPVHAET